MKHNIKITIIILTMFIITQLIGLWVVNFYLSPDVTIPYGFDQKQEIAQTPNFYTQFIITLIISFIIALFFIFFLMKIKSVLLIKVWFFIVIAFALGITLSALLLKFNIPNALLIALIIGLVLDYFKIFRRNIIVHNITELMIYPGIAAIFVTLLNLPTTIILLIIISVYDMWAVWKSGIMQKMAKYQINNIGVLGGFFIPYASRSIREKIRLLKLKYKSHIPSSIIKRQKIKVNLAILGGGDIVFPIIASGVVLKAYNSMPAALIVSLFATLALLSLFLIGKRKKFYPAMPYITTGIFIGMLIVWFLFR